jgi:signal peptidase
LWFLGFLALGLVAAWLLVGFRPKCDIQGASSTQIVLVFVLFYLILIYLLGLVTGFLTTSYSLEPMMILRNTLPAVGVVVVFELLRYAIVKRIGDHKGALVGVALAFSAIWIIVNSTRYDLSSPMDSFEFIGQGVLGVIAANAMLTFVAYKSDFRPTLAYALILTIYPYLVPIVPDLGPFIYSVLAIMLPTLLFIRFNEFFTTHRPIPGREKRTGRIIASLPVVAVLATVVVLVAGIFRYWAMAIGSDSMQPAIGTGDVVIIDKSYGSIQDVELGSVIAFRHDGQVITHRLIEVKNSASGLQIQTKGDSNGSDDAWTVKESDMVGVVRFRIPFIGWPTVWLERTF